MGRRSEEGSMKDVAVRPVTLRDRDALWRLYVAFHEFHVRGVPDRLVSIPDPPDDADRAELYTAIDKILNDDDATILVAEVDGEVVGLAEVYLRRDEANSRTVTYTYGHLQSLTVDEALRGRSIGTRLLAAAEQWARDKGATEIRLDTWEFEQGPLRFYEANGYRTFRRAMVRAL
jgi:GNAT superfamily N-acetyltransferase